MENAKSKKGGRPTSYRPEFAEQARKLCLLGYTDKQLAKHFQVAVSTVSKWKLDYPEFSEALKTSKEVADAEVLNALYQRAIGYQVKTQKVIGKGDSQTVIDVVENHLPDVTAGIYWLNNRQRQKFSRNPDPVQDDDVPSPVKITIQVIDASVLDDE